MATAAAVQAAYTEHAAGRSRYDLEHTVKKIVRHPDPDEAA
ncbi:hypothetical protein [Streptomyces rubiginosohelvolus]|nr:hypothetical protein OG475_34110 [Streptomyces rubiginosohelvolus]